MATAKERYNQLVTDREQFLQRARHNAMLTIPSLMPLEGHDAKAHLIEPYQSLGSTGVVSMSSRVTMALIPAGRPHLRLDLPAQELLKLDGEVPPEVNQQLAKGEKLIQAAVEKANWRARTLDSVQQLIVCGSVTEEFLEDNSIRVHRLDHFVWRRDSKGRVVECVIMESWDKDTAPAEVPQEAQSSTSSTSMMPRSEDTIEVYVHIKLMRRGSEFIYEVTKETESGTQFSSEEYPEGRVPYLFLRWGSTPGEDYGRSKVEEVIGDLRSLDSLSKQALELGAMGAKNFIMVRPGATANGLKNRLTRMSNGDVAVGDPESVELKQFNTVQGLQSTEAMIDRKEGSLSRAFLIMNSTQRDAERVTATEIERDIQELESVLGGTFSMLSLEMLERRTDLLIANMITRGEFPPVDDGVIEPTILTGLEALSRERDVSRGMQAAQAIQTFGDEAIKRVKLDVVLDKVMVGLGFPDAIKDEAQVQAEDKARSQQALAQQAVGPAIQAAARGGPE